MMHPGGLEDSEAYRVLLGMSQSGSGTIPPEILACRPEHGRGDSRRKRRGFLIVNYEQVEGSPRRPERDEEPGDDPGRLERELDAIVLAADETRDQPGAEPPPPPAAAGAAPMPTAPEVRRLFAALEIQPTESGGLRIEASAEAAAALAALFQGLAELLQNTGGR